MYTEAGSSSLTLVLFKEGLEFVSYKWRKSVMEELYLFMIQQ